MTEEEPGLPAGEEVSPPREGTSRAPPSPPSEAPLDAGSTQRLIRAVERKVASQWRKATGAFLAFTSGFSWRRPDAAGEPRVIARRVPSGRLRRRTPRARLWFGIAFALAVAAGLAAWIFALREPPPPPPGPLFPR
ncbi:MAG: hypothetical protein D6731_12330 [Planctomycetota bacterium]|nr:MAG: hypothetical protein D6731_12330 [Planctomycetota bacterium]